jgi:Clp amino terminal domain, pathogenicity island component
MVGADPKSRLRIATLSELSDLGPTLPDMTPRTKKTAAALSGALVLASGAYALGSQASDGAALAGSTTASSSQQPGRPFGRGHHRDDLSGLAGRLGVSQAKLHAALADLRPDRRDDHEGVVAKALAGALGLSTVKVQAALEQLHGQRKLKRDDRRADGRDAFAQALATKLGVSAAKVRAGLEAVRPDRRGAGPPDLGTLAQKIGVSEAKLRAALDDVRPGRPGRPGRDRDHDGPGFGPGGAALAKALGVSEARLRAAFEKIRPALEKQHQAERDAFIAKLAGKLGVSEAKVKDAIGAEPHHGRRGP